MVDSTEGTASGNCARRMFAVNNGGHPQTTGVDVHYLAVCDKAAAAGRDART